MKSEDVRAALRNRYSDNRRYAIAEEVGLQTGFSHRRLDMMVLDCYASNGFRIDGIEIKVSKADLKRELEDPEKHVAFFDVIDYFTLACPEGVADLSVIPPKWGVMLIREDGSTRYLRRPMALHDAVERAVPRGFLASITRAIQGHQPSAEELSAEYWRGREEGEKATKHMLDYQQKRYVEIVDDYDKLQRRLHLWGDVEKTLDKFEAFMECGAEYFPGKCRMIAEQMREIADAMEGKSDADA